MALRPFFRLPSCFEYIHNTRHSSASSSARFYSLTGEEAQSASPAFFVVAHQLYHPTLACFPSLLTLHIPSLCGTPLKGGLALFFLFVFFLSVSVKLPFSLWSFFSLVANLEHAVAPQPVANVLQTPESPLLVESHTARIHDDDSNGKRGFRFISLTRR